MWGDEQPRPDSWVGNCMGNLRANTLPLASPGTHHCNPSIMLKSVGCEVDKFLGIYVYTHRTNKQGINKQSMIGQMNFNHDASD